MKYIKPFSFLFLLLLFYNCNKIGSTVDERLNNFDHPIITGFEFKNEEGMSIGSYGEPVNNKLEDKETINESEYYLNAFPNPAADFYMVYTKTPDARIFKKIWIVKASYNGELPNIEIYNNAIYLVAGQYHLIEVSSQGNLINIDLSSLDDGFYRIYVEMDGNVLYDNFIVYKNKN